MAPGYIIVWRSPASVSVTSALNSTHPQSRLSPDICYLHRCISYLTARPGRRSICYTDSSLYLYQLSAWSTFNPLHHFKRIAFSTESSLVLTPFSGSLLHVLIIWKKNILYLSPTLDNSVACYQFKPQYYWSLSHYLAVQLKELHFSYRGLSFLVIYMISREQSYQFVI